MLSAITPVVVRSDAVTPFCPSRHTGPICVCPQLQYRACATRLTRPRGHEKSLANFQRCQGRRHDHSAAQVTTRARPVPDRGRGLGRSSGAGSACKRRLKRGVSKIPTLRGPCRRWSPWDNGPLAGLKTSHIVAYSLIWFFMVGLTAVKPKTSHIVAHSRCSPLGSFGLGLTWIGRFSAG
jgi:hypothetical protein